MSNFEIEKPLVSSTFHVSYDDVIKLNEMIKCDQNKLSYPFWAEEYEYGIVVSFSNYFDLAQWPSNIFSEGLMNLVIFTYSLGCNKLRLDCDGPIYDGFKKYDW